MLLFFHFLRSYFAVISILLFFGFLFVATFNGCLCKDIRQWFMKKVYLDWNALFRSVKMYRFTRFTYRNSERKKYHVISIWERQYGNIDNEVWNVNWNVAKWAFKIKKIQLKELKMKVKCIGGVLRRYHLPSSSNGVELTHTHD